MMEIKKTIWIDENTTPPKNYIWKQGDEYKEYNEKDGWVKSENIDTPKEPDVLYFLNITFTVEYADMNVEHILEDAAVIQVLNDIEEAINKYDIKSFVFIREVIEEKEYWDAICIHSNYLKPPKEWSIIGKGYVAMYFKKTDGIWTYTNRNVGGPTSINVGDIMSGSVYLILN